MEVYQQAVSIVKQLMEAGHQAYFAGGWVRDHVMGHDSDDIDIATSAKPEEILDLFPRTLLVGLQFGVVIVLIDGHQFEVATFRKDVEYSNGRSPEKIEFCDAREDALRRDFTINGMFYDPLTHEIYDYVGGVEDIHKSVVRTIGEPDARFLEDRLRMIRAFRFSSRFGFVIDQETQDAIYANAPTLFPAVAMERVWQEFTKMAQYPRFETAIIEMHRLALLPVVFPDLEGVHLNDIKQAVLHFEQFPQGTPAILYLVQLFPDASVERMTELCRYLRTSGREIRTVACYFRGKELLVRDDVADIEWVHYYADPFSRICLQVLTAGYPEEERIAFLDSYINRWENLLSHIMRVANKQPLISGAVLQVEGVKPGPKMGQLIREAERLVIENDINDKQEALELLKTSSMWEGTGDEA
ncbi:MAG: CCA tRNA nucleotidyltransferase [Chlamydiales bacterium]|nr:CCA tRNA nucleotidyltransferase [Chlamydiia bacterium]MCP5507996.1 CCA tRNA nucleotidyltransferase [Chlamydiales bacterium]